MPTIRTFCALICLVLVTSNAYSFDKVDGRFMDAAAGAKRDEINFALKAVDTYNSKAAAGGLEAIPYKAYALQLPFMQKALDFVFPGLDPAQFDAVKKLYGGFSKTQAQPGRHDYHLADFMPPTIQALTGHTFQYAQAEVPAINEGRGTWMLADPNGKIDQTVTTSVNCWATVYGIVANESFTNAKAQPDIFPLFYTGRFQAYDYFSKLGKAVQPGQARLGDVLLVQTDRQLLRDVEYTKKGGVTGGKPGSTITVLEHAMIYIDDGLVFEKSNGGSDDPFRFMSLQTAVESYQPGREGGPAGMKILVRRPNPGVLPKPADIFGGTAYAVNDKWRKPIPRALQKMILMSKEISFPEEGSYYNSWSQAVDVPLIWDGNRYRLGPEAYQSSTFDAAANAAKCENAL
jgi:hypothetical protein